MMQAIERERDQMLQHWRKRIANQPDWIASEWKQVNRVFAASSGGTIPHKTLASSLRQFHDKLGFMAKGAAVNGGLCAGALFRTAAFIAVDERCGAKGDRKNVHIEHTFPINQLERAILQQHFVTYAHVLAWLLKHSVATAFHQTEERHLLGRTQSSGALTAASAAYQKPFMRYSCLHDAHGVVWNVFDREPVDPNTFTFKDHLDLVCRVLKTVGASSSMVEQIQAAAAS
ncbi:MULTISPECIES: hypothetical protein [unclassified Bradyrhizobium]|uniref:hypothetical protein n=1 Tax=unclassified Bradyrhizobium TaxID=2631580 RepID=UPI001FF75877|nr:MULTISPECIES: hypothetical protein [unclassified Bradyrhizobium]MCK1269758.1 hypothetical protein [Bradyrhizobium sp. 84]